MSEAAGERGRRFGVLGAVVGAAAAGIAAGIATERTLIRRMRHRAEDPYAQEPFGRLPYDEVPTVTTPDGVDLHVEVVDPTDGVELDAGFAASVAASPPRPEPTVVFVHGFCLGMGSFHFQRRALTRRGDWRAVYYDQPGHGRSGRMRSADYELAALADALHAVVEATTPHGPVVLVGHSMGGMAILSFAERYPELFAERVAATVLVATSAGRAQDGAYGLPELLGRLGRPLLPLLSGATRFTGGAIEHARRVSTDLSWLLTRRYGFGGDRPSPALVSFVEKMISDTPVETVVRHLRTLHRHTRTILDVGPAQLREDTAELPAQLREDTAGLSAQLREDTAGLSAGSPGDGAGTAHTATEKAAAVPPALVALRERPALLICGDRDPITPRARSEEIRTYLPDAELLVVPESGHLVLLEHPEEVNAALLGFLEKLT